MAGVLVFGLLFGYFNCSRPPAASLIRAWRYRLAACDSSNFAAFFDAFPFTGALEKLNIRPKMTFLLDILLPLL